MDSDKLCMSLEQQSLMNTLLKFEKGTILTNALSHNFTNISREIF